MNRDVLRVVKHRKFSIHHPEPKHTGPNNNSRRSEKCLNCYLNVLEIDNNLSDQDLGTYGDNMEFFRIDNGAVIDEASDIDQDDNEAHEDSLTMSTLQSYNLEALDALDNSVLNQEAVSSSDPDNDEIFYIQLLEEDEEVEDEIADNNIIDEEIYEEIQPVGKSRPHIQSNKNFMSASSYKIPVVPDFDSFESETFSDARRRIPEHFRQLIRHPWINAWW